MDKDAILLRLREVLAAVDPSLPSDMPASSPFLAEEWALDSLDLIEFVARLEQRFALHVPDADLPKFLSLDASVEYIHARCSA